MKRALLVNSVKESKEDLVNQLEEDANENENNSMNDIDNQPKPKYPRKTSAKAKNQDSLTKPRNTSKQNKSRSSSRTSVHDAKAKTDEICQKPHKTEKKQLRPIFFKSPDDATEEQRKDLYGPFYVTTKPNTKLPNAYAELAAILD